MPSQIKVDQITGSASSTVSIPSGTTLDLSASTIIFPTGALVPNYVKRTLITTVGSGTYTRPANLVTLRVWCLGGGGGGGGASSAVTTNGQGGCSGAICFKSYAFADLSSTESYTVGAGGTGGAAGGNDGTAGGATTFKGMTANGGTQGYSTASGSRTSTVVLATASGGDKNYSSAIQGSTTNTTEGLSSISQSSTNASSAAQNYWVIVDGNVLGNGNTFTLWDIPIGTAGFNATNAPGYGLPGGGADGNSLDLAGGNGQPGAILFEELF
jgi:hypothetical protein